MDKELKKDIFLKIIESLFNDYSNEIDRGNCISFYHFLIDTLHDEIEAIPGDEEADISLCHCIIDILCNFHLMSDSLDEWEREETLDFLQDYSGLSKEEFETSISKFRKIYHFIKNDFILGLT
jgi:ubiquitin C-terminal hydrolase